MANNIPFGTYVSDGVRSGPLYTGLIPPALLASNPNVPLSYSGYSTYGPAVLYSPINTWNIVPAAPGDGFTTLNNVVAEKTALQVPGAAYLPLTGDNSSTQYIGGNEPYVQLDWPRVITVTIGGEALTAQRRVTIFGTDWYGFALQQTYIVEAEGTYPDINLGNDTPLSIPSKAFYSVDKVYINGALTGDSTISLGAADLFGLPYVANNAGDIVAIGWGDFSELTTLINGDPLTVLGSFTPADQTFPATALTGDVRGLYAPSSEANDTRRLRFMYYVMGADTWLNQVANAQFLNQSNNIPVVGITVPELNPQDLYGQTQFYTGNPS